MLSALNSTAADVCGDCGIVIAGGRAVVTAAAVKFLIGKRLRRKLILMEKAGLDIAALTAENFGLAGPSCDGPTHSNTNDTTPQTRSDAGQLTERF